MSAGWWWDLWICCSSPSSSFFLSSSPVTLTPPPRPISPPPFLCYFFILLFSSTCSASYSSPLFLLPSPLSLNSLPPLLFLPHTLHPPPLFSSLPSQLPTSSAPPLCLPLYFSILSISINQDATFTCHCPENRAVTKMELCLTDLSPSLSCQYKGTKLPFGHTEVMN